MIWIMNLKLSIVSIILILMTEVETYGQSKGGCMSYDSIRATSDISSGQVKLLLWSGDPPIRGINDSSVERRFEFRYDEFGCVKAENDSCLFAYCKLRLPIWTKGTAKFGDER